MKKILSILISLMLIFTSFTVCAYASSANDLNSTGKAEAKAKIQQILGEEASTTTLNAATNDVMLLNNTGIEKEYLSKVHKNKNATFTYTYNFPNNIVDEITPKTTDDGYVLQIKEGVLYNEVLFKNSGEVYLNGMQVKYEVTKIAMPPATTELPTSKSTDIQPRLINDYYTMTCPYGSASNYSVYQKTITNANVGLGNSMIDITVGAFCAILTFFCPQLALATAALSIGLSLFKSSNPNSTAASVKDYIYNHTKGYFVTQTLAVQKHKSIMYPLANYQGNSTIINSYFCHEIGY